MIVGFKPGPGHTIRNARVVLKPNETLPNRYNVLESEVLRQHPETFEEILVKPVGVILPADSDLLSQPEIAITSILDLTKDIGKGDTYGHADIIRFEETGENAGSDSVPDPATLDDSGDVVR